MDSFIPQWLQDISAISSIIGLMVTVFLYIEARKIKASFLRRARLPEVLKDLSQASNKLSKSLGNWETEQRSGMEQISITRGLLDNLHQKLPEMEQKKVKAFIGKLSTKKYFVFKTTITSATEDQAWELYNELITLITSLEQLQKDTRWD